MCIRDRVKGDNYCMRYYVGDRKYKVISLQTNDENTARVRAMEKWRLLANHIEAMNTADRKRWIMEINKSYRRLKAMASIHQEKALKHTAFYAYHKKHCPNEHYHSEYWKVSLHNDSLYKIRYKIRLIDKF